MEPISLMVLGGLGLWALWGGSKESAPSESLDSLDSLPVSDSTAEAIPEFSIQVLSDGLVDLSQSQKNLLYRWVKTLLKNGKPPTGLTLEKAYTYAESIYAVLTDFDPQNREGWLSYIKKLNPGVPDSDWDKLLSGLLAQSVKFISWKKQGESSGIDDAIYGLLDGLIPGASEKIQNYTESQAISEFEKALAEFTKKRDEKK